MIVLTRKLGERICIAGHLVTITVVEFGMHKIKLGIEAPEGLSVNREEVQTRIDAGSPDTKNPADQSPWKKIALDPFLHPPKE